MTAFFAAVFFAGAFFAGAFFAGAFFAGAFFAGAFFAGAFFAGAFFAGAFFAGAFFAGAFFAGAFLTAVFFAGAFFAVVAIVSGRTFPLGTLESHDKSPSQAVIGLSGVCEVCHARLIRARGPPWPTRHPPPRRPPGAPDHAHRMARRHRPSSGLARPTAPGRGGVRHR